MPDPAQRLSDPPGLDDAQPDPDELAAMLDGAWDRLQEPVEVDDMDTIRRRRAARAETPYRHSADTNPTS
jgi:hypothetical protein